MTKRDRLLDGWAGFWSGLRRRRIDHFSDHAIAAYVELIAAAEEIR